MGIYRGRKTPPKSNIVVENDGWKCNVPFRDKYGQNDPNPSISSDRNSARSQQPTHQNTKNLRIKQFGTYTYQVPGTKMTLCFVWKKVLFWAFLGLPPPQIFGRCPILACFLWAWFLCNLTLPGIDGNRVCISHLSGFEVRFKYHDQNETKCTVATAVHPSTVFNMASLSTTSQGSKGIYCWNLLWCKHWLISPVICFFVIKLSVWNKLHIS